MTGVYQQMIQHMVEAYTAQCWLKYHTVEDVHNAVDKFVNQLRGE